MYVPHKARPAVPVADVSRLLRSEVPRPTPVKDAAEVTSLRRPKMAKASSPPGPSLLQGRLTTTFMFDTREAVPPSLETTSPIAHIGIAAEKTESP